MGGMKWHEALGGVTEITTSEIPAGFIAISYTTIDVEHYMSAACF